MKPNPKHLKIACGYYMFMFILTNIMLAMTLHICIFINTTLWPLGIIAALAAPVEWKQYILCRTRYRALLSND